ncbi:MAG: S-layer homology domain-containing protein, partial [Syntrophomonadaceae bacterium]|nr:S-layer homology domain-containing protein [Syntrophomonadaceae bacterium]
MRKNKIIAFLVMLIFALSIVNPVAYAKVDDITGHWAEKPIREMMNQGIISGYPDGSFKPDEKITRAEFAALVVKGFKLSGKSGKVFADTADHWAKDFIATANAYGIVNGYSNSNFGPNDPITREQMAVMIIKAVGLTDTGSARTFADSQNISSWAREAVAIATGNNIMTGYPDFTFKPQGNATRAEAAVVLDKTLAIKAAPVEEEEQVKAEYVSIDKAGT